MTKPDNLSRDAIRSLTWIILTALMGIITLSVIGAMLRAGVFTSSEPSDAFTTADEALSILGNIAAAAVGGLVGWLTRDLVVNGPTSMEEPVSEFEADLDVAGPDPDDTVETLLPDDVELDQEPDEDDPDEVIESEPEPEPEEEDKA